MKYRIAEWAIAGFAGGRFLGVVAYVIFPFSSERMRGRMDSDQRQLSDRDRRQALSDQSL
jgi:hypothetical protein